MPNICFSYPDGVPPGSGTRGVPQSGLRSMLFACFSYQADVPPSMPLSCFSYSADVPPGIRNRDAAPRGGQPGLPSGTYLSYPVLPCFRY